MWRREDLRIAFFFLRTTVTVQGRRDPHRFQCESVTDGGRSLSRDLCIIRAFEEKDRQVRDAYSAVHRLLPDTWPVQRDCNRRATTIRTLQLQYITNYMSHKLFINCCILCAARDGCNMTRRQNVGHWCSTYDLILMTFLVRNWVSTLQTKSSRRGSYNFDLLMAFGVTAVQNVNRTFAECRKSVYIPTTARSKSSRSSPNSQPSLFYIAVYSLSV